MKIQADKGGTIDGFRNTINSILNCEQTKGLLIFACDANVFTPSNIDGHLKNIPVPVFGGIFPNIIIGNEKLERGTIIANLTKCPNVQIIPGLSNKEMVYEDVIDKKIPYIGLTKTMFFH